MASDGLSYFVPTASGFAMNPDGSRMEQVDVTASRIAGPNFDNGLFNFGSNENTGVAIDPLTGFSGGPAQTCDSPAIPSVGITAQYQGTGLTSLPGTVIANTSINANTVGQIYRTTEIGGSLGLAGGNTVGLGIRFGAGRAASNGSENGTGFWLADGALNASGSVSGVSFGNLQGTDDFSGVSADATAIFELPTLQGSGVSQTITETTVLFNGICGG
jgi:hypothetical protein